MDDGRGRAVLSVLLDLDNHCWTYLEGIILFYVPSQPRLKKKKKVILLEKLI